MALDQIDVGDDYYKEDESQKKLGSPEKEMTFLDHLEELRWHIIRSLIAIVVSGIGVFLSGKTFIHTVILGPKNADFWSYRIICKLSNAIGLGDQMCFSPVQFDLITTELGEEFLSHIKISFISGFIIAFPFIFWEVWKFVRPGLYEKEQKVVRGIVFICSALFFTGVLFGYFVIAPFAVNFLAGYDIGVVTSPRLNSFVNYMVMFTAPAGMIFELPVAVYFLAKMGLVTASDMKKYRRHAIIIILMVAAVITPPDVVTQFLIGIPLFVLYEISINIARRVEKQLEKEMA